MKGIFRLGLLSLLSSLLCWQPISAEETGDLVVSIPDPNSYNPDSVRSLTEITVHSRIRHHETIEPQLLKSVDLERLNAHNVADALRFASGVTMKDYGGIGGLKTVNLRSMGSEHVGIYYDGIELGNAQNGVIDLGQLSLDNIEEVGIYRGQRSAILQSASDFVHSGSVYIRTRRATNLTADRPQLLRSRLQVGATALLRLSALYERRISDQLSMSINAEGLTSNGRYPFRYRRINMDGTIAYDTTAIRQNGDIQALRAEVNLFGRSSSQGHWEAKAYTYHSARGIPGAIVNNVWRRGERQSDDNTWLQTSFQRDFTSIYTLKALAKYAHYRTHYINRDTTQLMVDNTFRQQEAYLSLIQVVELQPWWSVSLSLDGRWNHLDANIARFAHPTRWSAISSLAMAMDLDRLQLQASLAHADIMDRNALTGTDATHHHWAPALFASYRISPQIKLTGYAKKSFRMPTMNDLFYTDMGNALLDPEVALQYDLGMEWSNRNLHPTAGNIGYQFSAHLYHNAVHDKIVAYPKGQQFRWTMLNLGRVHIDGIDVSASAQSVIAHGITLSGRLGYTYQRARDVSDPSTSYYGDQIPYTPWHYGSATVMLMGSEWELAINQVYTGERYSQQENLPFHHLQPWYTTDMHLSYRFPGRNMQSKVTLEVNNLWDQQYDVIINYPMPGRNLNITLQCDF